MSIFLKEFSKSYSCQTKQYFTSSYFSVKTVLISGVSVKNKIMIPYSTKMYMLPEPLKQEIVQKNKRINKNVNTVSQ